MMPAQFKIQHDVSYREKINNSTSDIALNKTFVYSQCDQLNILPKELLAHDIAPLIRLDV